MSSKIAETISGLHEIHAHASHRLEVRKFNDSVQALQKTRVIWNLYRAGVKTATNFFSPFAHDGETEVARIL